ncbi:hypothetical protein TNCV_808421 [Trichonephila clavipes]|nr:hypothetical protein TNCV_808421 [Trichonephila clavipes]
MSSTFPSRCSRLPIASQTCSIEERSHDLAGQESVWQAKRYQNSSQNVVEVPLCSKYASNDDHGAPAVKRNVTPDQNYWLRACGACNSESRINALPSASPDTPLMIVRTQLGADSSLNTIRPQSAFF